jgi:predicted permease
MSLRSRVTHLWTRLRHPGRIEQDLDDEVRDWFETMVDRRIGQGASPEEARRAATLAFGPPDGVKEKVREARVEAAFGAFVQDLRYAFRLMRKSPGFTAVAVLSLGLGLGANTAIFTLIDTVLLKALPVSRADRLFFVDNSGGKSGGGSGPPYPCYEILRDGNRFFSGMSAFSNERFRVRIDGEQEPISGQYASGSYFQLLGVRPAIGRLLTPADDSEIGRGGPDGGVAVISYGLWERRFGRSPAVLGKSIVVGTTAVTIVGVTPPEFYGLQPGSPADLTIPMMLTTNNLRAKQYWWFSVIGRLQDGAAVEPARADLDRLFQSYMEEVGSKGSRASRYFSGIALVPASKGLAGLRRQFSRPLWIVMAIVGLVLLIGCANVANLLLARAGARRHEIGLRLAIGAGRGRIVRQLLTEGLLLAVAAAGVGLLFAWFGVALLVRLFAGVEGRIVLHPEFDWRVLAFTGAVAVLSAILFSVAPALHAARSAAAMPGGGGRGGVPQSQVTAGNALVVVQIVFSVVLLGGAALFLRTLENLNRLDAGFQPDGVLLLRAEATLRKNGPLEGKAAEEEHARLGRMWQDLLDPAGALPGVRAASVSTLSPLSRRDRGILIAVPGAPPRPEADRGIHINQVSAGYFAAFGVSAVSGRVFTPGDAANAPKVAILNESAARREFPGSDPLGRLITFPGQHVPGPYQVVGIVRDTRYENLRKAAEPMVYVPIEQAIELLSSVVVAVRSQGAAAAIQSAVRRRAQSIVPGGFVSVMGTLRQQVEESLIQERLLSILAALFGGLALLLAAIGLYGIMSFTVIRRMREIGIRIAVGARRGAVLWLVLRTALGLAALGLALGVPAVLIGRRYIESELFGLERGDPLAVGSAAALLLTVALAASVWPAWRASRVDPMVSLRQE